PELGGMGQWSLGGMTMIGDMFNNALKARVDGLCADLSNAMAGTQVFQPTPAPAPASTPASSSQSQSQSSGGGAMGSSLFVSGSGFGSWWPQELGQPSATGAQNNMHYAYFPATARLAIQINGQVSVYDTGPHQIGGFGQQQSGDQSLTFTSQLGLVRVADLPVVSLEADQPSPEPSTEPVIEPVPEATTAPEPEPEPEPVQPPAQPEQPVPAPVQQVPPQQAAPTPAAALGSDADAIFDSLEKLASLRDRGILTEDEFTAKKADLLARL
ncbi:MAG: SHOCT domain-containing protein, partial [Rhodospirillaceae bacterium]